MDLGYWANVAQVISILPLGGGALTMWYKHDCHVKGCLRLQWHPHPEHGHPVCKKHYPDDPPA